MMLDISSVRFLTKKICDIQRITSDGRADPNLALPNPSNGVEVTPLQGGVFFGAQPKVSKFSPNHLPHGRSQNKSDVMHVLAIFPLCQCLSFLVKLPCEHWGYYYAGIQPLVPQDFGRISRDEQHCQC